MGGNGKGDKVVRGGRRKKDGAVISTAHAPREKGKEKKQIMQHRGKRGRRKLAKPFYGLREERGRD